MIGIFQIFKMLVYTYDLIVKSTINLQFCMVSKKIKKSIILSNTV